jgi:hypothetical protein
VLALAEAFPAERYGWRPAETARSVSEVLVHIGAGGRSLLALLGVDASQDLYGKLEGEGLAKVWAMFKRNESLEKSKTDKAEVVALLRKSLEGIRTAFTEASDTELDRAEMFGGESTTVRRLYICELYATCTSTWDSSSPTLAQWAYPRRGRVSGKLNGRPLRKSWRPQR